VRDSQTVFDGGNLQFELGEKYGRFRNSRAGLINFRGRYMKTRAGKNDDGIFTGFFVDDDCGAAGSLFL
jgi:hypothetical protein